MIAFAASKTETWTIAIVLTATGVAGFLEATSAAFAFESVTTSAWTHVAAASITAASGLIRARRLPPSLTNRRDIFAAVDITAIKAFMRISFTNTNRRAIRVVRRARNVLNDLRNLAEIGTMIRHSSAPACRKSAQRQPVTGPWIRW